MGTNGAGGPGILQTLGSVAAAVPLLPAVTGVRGGLMATFDIEPKGEQRPCQGWIERRVGSRAVDGVGT